jgi:hypothetical protein
LVDSLIDLTGATVLEDLPEEDDRLLSDGDP